MWEILFIFLIICFYLGILLWWHKPHKYHEPKQTQNSKDLERLAQISNDIYYLTYDKDWNKIQNLRRERIDILSKSEYIGESSLQIEQDLTWLNISKIGDEYYYASCNDT